MVKNLILTGALGNIGSAFVNWAKLNAPNLLITHLKPFPFSIESLIQVMKTKPDYFVALAGPSDDKSSKDYPCKYFEAYSDAVKNTLEVIRQYHPSCRFCAAGTIYEADLDRNSPYVYSKRISRLLVKSYRENHNIFAIQPYFVHIESVNRRPNFLSQKIVRETIRLYNDFIENGVLNNTILPNPTDKFYWLWADDAAAMIWEELNREVPQDKTIFNPINYFSINDFINVGFSYLVTKERHSDKYPESFTKIVYSLIDHNYKV